MEHAAVRAALHNGFCNYGDVTFSLSRQIVSRATFCFFGNSFNNVVTALYQWIYRQSNAALKPISDVSITMPGAFLAFIHYCTSAQLLFPLFDDHFPYQVIDWEQRRMAFTTLPKSTIAWWRKHGSKHEHALILGDAIL